MIQSFNPSAKIGDYRCSECGQPVDELGKNCGPCSLNSIQNGNSSECDYCNGRKVVPDTSTRISSAPIYNTCPSCHGTGQKNEVEVDPTHKCPYCDIKMTEIEPCGSDYYCHTCGWGNCDSPVEEAIEFVDKCLEKYDARQIDIEDIVVRMPPISRRKIKFKVREYKKGVPRSTRLDEDDGFETQKPQVKLSIRIFTEGIFTQIALRTSQLPIASGGGFRIYYETLLRAVEETIRLLDLRVDFLDDGENKNDPILINPDSHFKCLFCDDLFQIKDGHECKKEEKK